MKVLYSSLFSIILDKASMAFEGQDEFFIAKLLVEPGAEVPVGSPILVSVEDESSIAAFEKFVAPAAASAVAAPAPIPVAAPTPIPVAAPTPVPVAPKVEIAAPVKATPAVTPPITTPSAAAPITSIEGTYSVRSKATSKIISPLSSKLGKQAAEYDIKYGRAKLEKSKEDVKGKGKAKA